MGWDEIKQTAKAVEGMDWTTEVHKNYLFYGDSKVGKTYLSMEKIKRVLDSNPKNICYVLNTDMGFAEPAKQYGLDKYKDRIKYFHITDLKQCYSILNNILTTIKPTDILVFDLLAWIWDEAQKEFITELSGGNVIGFVKKGLMDEKKYGLFQGLQWGYIKKLDDLITVKLSRSPVCNVIAITSVKDVSVDYVLNKKKADLWLEIGKPAGRKDIMFDFAEIIKIEKDEKGQRRYMIVGTRKQDSDYSWHKYTTPADFWNQVEK